MPTHASIIVKTATGYLRSYVQFDGDDVGRNLRAGDYGTQEKAEALVKMGEARSIGLTIETSEFYARDKHEVLRYNTGRSLETEWLSDYDYVYIWTGTEWRTAKEGYRDVVTLPEGF